MRTLTLQNRRKMEGERPREPNQIYETGLLLPVKLVRWYGFTRKVQAIHSVFYFFTKFLDIHRWFFPICTSAK